MNVLSKNKTFKKHRKVRGWGLCVLIGGCSSALYQPLPIKHPSDTIQTSANRNRSRPSYIPLHQVPERPPRPSLAEIERIKNQLHHDIATTQEARRQLIDESAGY